MGLDASQFQFRGDESQRGARFIELAEKLLVEVRGRCIAERNCEGSTQSTLCAQSRHGCSQNIQNTEQGSKAQLSNPRRDRETHEVLE